MRVSQRDKLSLVVLILLAGTANLLAAPPVGAPATQPDSIPSIQALMQLVPAEAYPEKGGSWNAVRVEMANTGLRDNALNKVATLSLKVVRVAKPPEGLTREELEARGGEFRIEAATFTVGGLLVRQFAYFEPEQMKRLASLREGAAVTVSGKIVQCNLGKTGDKWSFTVVLGRSKFDEKTAK